MHLLTYAITANGVCLHLLVPPLTQCCFFGASYCINGWVYFRDKSTLCNNFIQKRGVGVFLRVGLFSGDYGSSLIGWKTDCQECKSVTAHWLVSDFKYQQFAVNYTVYCKLIYRNLPKISPPSKIRPPPYFEWSCCKGCSSLESTPTQLCCSTCCYVKQEATKKQHCARGGTNKWRQTPFAVVA